MTSPVNWITYAEAAERLGIKPSSVKRRAIQRKWPRQIGNDGLARIQIPDDAVPSPTLKGTSDSTDAATGGITGDAVGEGARVQELAAELADVRADLAGARAEAAGLRDRLADAHADRDRLAGLLEKALEPKPSIIARIFGR